ncbi:MAG: aminotransferase class V-fold PLP-dependent enzyme [Pseudomonadales bacterium]|jgi:cysteine desulfurase/selenocysteine lyase
MTPDIAALRAEFPILSTRVHDIPLVYLDNAATTQKPQAVIDALTHYYGHDNANVHRGAHTLADRATRDFEAARDTTAAFIGAPDSRGVIFTRGTTESINLLANVLSERIGPGDEILVTELEHHANLVPWQMLATRTGAVLQVAAINDAGEVDLADFRSKLSACTRIAAFGHVSNALGTVNPVEEMTALAHAAGALVLVDGAQAVAHLPVNVQAIGCDFYAFSAHKLFAPTGVGVLWGRPELLDALPPWQGGGEMIETVAYTHSTWQPAPHRFEAGTPNIAGVIGLGAALRWFTAAPREALMAHEHTLVQATLDALAAIPEVRLIGTPRHRVSVVSFLLADAHPHDVGTLLDQQGVAVRTGHHCTMPLMQRLGVPGTVRASFSVYNTLDDVHRLVAGIRKTLTFL